LNQRQLVAVEFLKQSGVLTNAKYQELMGIRKTLASQEIQQLLDRKVINRVGNGPQTRYVLNDGIGDA
jgi:predicted HTH transcriptional regulator